MMTRKKRRTILVLIILVVILIIAGIFTLLYLRTDLLKSNKTLFVKYIGQTTSHLQGYINKVSESDYKTRLEQSKYTTDTNIEINYSDGELTAKEAPQNPINNLQINITGNVDKISNYRYNDIKLNQNDEEVAELEYIKNGSTYGIRFADLFRQYLLVDDNNLADLLEKLGYNSEEAGKISNSLELENSMSNVLQITEEEIGTLEEKYFAQMFENIDGSNYQKQSNQVIEIDGNNYTTNAYTLTLTKEQMYDFYLEILNEMKEDEIILSKIENLDTVLNTYYVALGQDKDYTLVDRYTSFIDEKIQEISGNRIGQDARTITVYETDGITVRVEAGLGDYQITFDMLPEVYARFYLKGPSIEEDISLIIQNTIVTFTAQTNNNNETKNLQIVRNRTVNGDNCNDKYDITYTVGTNELKTNITNDINIVSEFDEQVSLNQENSIVLSDLEQEQLNNLLETVRTNLDTRATEIEQTINIDEIRSVLVDLDILKQIQTLESTGVTETERTRYNSQFEIYRGTDLEAERVQSLVDNMEEFFSSIEITDNNVFKIKLDSNSYDENVKTTLDNFLEESRNVTYNVDVEYNSETGLAEYFVITVLGR